MGKEEVLYKFKKINTNVLEMLVEDYIYCADPTTFNDPFDSKPTVVADISEYELEKIFVKLVSDRIKNETKAAIRLIKYDNCSVVVPIEERYNVLTTKMLNEVRYYATEPELQERVSSPLSHLLAQKIRQELVKIYEKGIFCLSGKYNSHLMWSHYGDQHKGICIGYKRTKRCDGKLYKVTYGGKREIAASKIRDMISGDPVAQSEVDEIALLRKAACWKYEDELRYIDTIGQTYSPFELAEITFGCRCPEAVKLAVTSALEAREGDVDFFEMRECVGNFKMKRVELDISELKACCPRNYHAIISSFEKAAEI